MLMRAYSLTGDQQKDKVLESTIKRKHNALELHRGNTCSYLPIISCDSIIMSVFILPGKENKITSVTIKNHQMATRSSHPCYYIFTSTGYINGTAWLEILKSLKQQLCLKYEGFEPVLFLDRLILSLAY